MYLEPVNSQHSKYYFTCNAPVTMSAYENLPIATEYMAHKTDQVRNLYDNVTDIEN